MEISTRSAATQEKPAGRVAGRLLALGIALGAAIGGYGVALGPSEDVAVLAAGAGPVAFPARPPLDAAPPAASNLVLPLAERRPDAPPLDAGARQDPRPGEGAAAASPFPFSTVSAQDAYGDGAGASGSGTAANVLRDSPAPRFGGQGSAQAALRLDGKAAGKERSPEARGSTAALPSAPRPSQAVPAPGRSSRIAASGALSGRLYAGGAAGGSAFGSQAAASAEQAAVAAIRVNPSSAYLIGGETGWAGAAASQGIGSMPSSASKGGGAGGGAAPALSPAKGGKPSAAKPAKPAKPSKPSKPSGAQGGALSKNVMRRAFKIARQINQSGGYRFDGYNDCYGFVRRTWDALLDAMKQKRIPVNDGPSSAWRPIRDWNDLEPGDVLATAQGHMWGARWHGGLYAGKRGGTHMILDNSGSLSAKFRPHPPGLFKYYYSRTHDLLKKR